MIGEWFWALDANARVALGLPVALFMVYVWIRAAGHLVGMIRNSSGGLAMHLMGPLVPFIPRFFNEAGNRHRIEFLKYLTAFAVMCGAPFLVTLFPQ